MDIASFFSKVAGAAGGGVLGGALVNLRDYVTHLSASALEKWSMDYAMGVVCTAPTSKKGGCGAGSFGRCDGCGQPTCLYHGRISADADICCNVCLEKATGKADQSRTRQKRPDARSSRAGHDPERLAALEVMGLPPNATWPEVQKRFRELTGKFHPDKFKDPAKKASAEKRFKAVTGAYETLKRRAAA
jgi:hypothetical protein